MKIRMRFISLVLGFVGLLSMSVLILTITPLGLPLAVRVVSAIIPGEINVTGAQGRLIDAVTAKKIVYNNDHVSLTFQDVSLEWRAIRMLAGTVYIEKLSAGHVLVKILENDSRNSKAFNLESLALHETWMNVIIDKAQLNDIQVEPLGYSMNTLVATLSLNEQGLRLRQLHVDHPQVVVDAQANIGPAFNPPIKISAKEIWTPDKSTRIMGETQIKGNLQSLQASQAFKGGMVATLDVTAQNIGPEFTLSAKGKADIDDLTTFQKNLIGAMHVTLDLTYDHANGTGQTKLKSVDSTVNGKSFVLNFDGLIQDYAVRWINNTAILGSNTISTSGQYGSDNAHITWDIKAPALNEIFDELPVSLYFQGTYQKEGALWSQSGNLTISAYDTLLNSNFVFNALNINTLDVDIKTLTLAFPDASVYRLIKPAQIQASLEGVVLDSTACLIGPQNSSICAKNIDQSTLDMEATHIPHQLIARYFTPRFTVTGDINANAKVAFKDMQLNTLDIKAHVSPMEVIRGKRKQVTLFETGGGDIDFSLSAENLTTTGNLSFIDQDYFNWNIDVKNWNDLTLATLNADFKGKMQNFSPLRLFITETNDFSGKASLDLNATGKVLEPTYAGALIFKDIRLAVPSHGLILENGVIQLSPSTTKNQLDLQGALKSGEGTLALIGTLSLQDTWPSLDVKINGERFLISNTAKALVYASPRLRVQTKEKVIDVTGELHIPEAALNLQGYQSYIAPSPDIILVQDTPPVQSLLFDLNSRVLLSLGDKISLKASNLNTGVAGQLHLVQLSNAPTRATGQLSAVKGQYAAYGQKLNLSSAILTFNNTPLDNPALFIEASRRVQIVQAASAQYMFTDPTPQIKGNTIQEGTVGIRITGTVQNPKYTFYSKPSMPEADQLSYLLTGAPSSQVGAAQAAFMLGALTESTGMLGVSDTDSARLQGITRTLGLDMNIESSKHIDNETGEAVNDTNLVVGKALRPRLYVSYTVGLLDPLSMFRVRYQLSRHWALQSQTNTQGDSGGDILYGIESDAFLGIE